MTTFPGGTSVSRLSVYGEGGTPHLHTVSTEAYVVIGGTGTLLTLDTTGLHETPLATGSTVWFTPGTVHRAINHGDLRVLVIMSNAGLPEAGDAVMTFPTEIVADPARYRAAAHLAGDPELAVRHRRDLALEGFQQLVDAAETGDPKPLAEFYEAAAALVRPSVAGWRDLWRSTVEAATRQTAAVLDALDHGDARHLAASAVLGSPPSDPLRWGMCGRLGAHDVHHPAVLSEGTR
ncbi:cupin domain-containing protein [Actinoplanes sichuanensis]|uniref:Cupin domain-containing protein n=1 Tax=Actinoplanes sichuanensis TaxID=512349 RepID=A0ABW4A4P1_9ACTN|nr:cupin domain-containing protein [Actinoplanes sichuanensis]BEL03175.1 cupin domain-containing protein [Actinoplanes sichuanensis]